MIATDLQQAIAAMYAAPLDGFVERRSELARQLRSAGERDAANAVKALRKPSRLAWALNAGARAEPGAFARLDAAAAATVAAQASGGDVRAAIATLRAAVREFAQIAALNAEHAGQAIEVSVIANTVLAVLGRPDSMDQLRAGRLTETPEGGGLDFLAQLPAPPVATGPAPARPRGERRSDGDVGAAARAHAQRTAKALAAAGQRAGVADRALQAAETALAGAEQRLQQAKDQLAFAKKRRDDAREEAAQAAAELGSVERAHADAQRQLGQS